MFDLIKTVVGWYMAHINYFTITLFMAIESSFIPFPSEIVIPPAAWLAAEGKLNIVLVIGFGTLGAMIGAMFNYYLALWLGRPLIHRLADTKLAHLLLIDRASVDKAESYFRKFGRSSTFLGRFVPAVRQLISLPAGLARMNLRDFILFTFLGSGLWNAILAVLGFFLYTQKELLNRYYKEISYVFLGLGILFVGYILLKVFVLEGRKKKKTAVKRKKTKRAALLGTRDLKERQKQ